MLRARQRLGKYRIERRIARGPYADVYQAYDTIEGVRVALKIPHQKFTDQDLDDFRREVRLTAGLDHPHILPIKNAALIDDCFVIAYPLGQGNLEERLRKRLGFKKAISYADQLLQALAFAHSRRIVHCDVKPENLILFPGDRLRLADFGIAKVAQRTLRGSGSGTVGYLAPEQAMGKPSRSSDVFAAGLVLYRMFAGRLPEWPYEWPPPGSSRLKRRVHPDFVKFLRRALQVDKRKRFPDARQMLAAFRRLPSRRRRPSSQNTNRRRPVQRWKETRSRDFKRLYGPQLGARHACGRCGGPVSETMLACPWCGYRSRIYRGPTRFAERCRRCGRGMKGDWKFCAMCFGAAQGPRLDRRYPDRRYRVRCSACDGPLMAFTRYCPWCRRKVTQEWKIRGSRHTCPGCGWGVLPDFWTHCPWCSRRLR